MKVWRFRKYKTFDMKGPSSVISSEVDTDDNNVSMGTPEATVDGGQGKWQLIGTMQEQLPSLGDTFALDPVGDSINIALRRPFAIRFALCTVRRFLCPALLRRSSPVRCSSKLERAHVREHSTPWPQRRRLRRRSAACRRSW
jgi:hypothetical protein